MRLISNEGGAVIKTQNSTVALKDYVKRKKYFPTKSLLNEWLNIPFYLYILDVSQVANN